MTRTSKKAVLGGCAGPLTLAAAMAAGGLIWSSSARAALTLTISEPGAPGSPTQTVTDNGTGDNDPTAGSIEFNDSNFGDFKTNVLVGFSNKNDPTAGPQADLQIQSLDVTKNTNASTATLVITLADTGFTFPGNSGDNMLMSSSLAGTVTNSAVGTPDNVTFKSVSSPSGATTPLQTAVLPGNPTLAPVPFTASPPTTSANFLRGTSYDLSNITTITLSNGNESTNISGTTTVTSLGPPVPEPTSAAMLAISCIPLLYRRTRRAH